MIYDVHLNNRTHNFGGLEYVVDGEMGRWTYPATLPECLVRRLYNDGLSNVPNGYCDGCEGSHAGYICSKIRRENN